MTFSSLATNKLQPQRVFSGATVSATTGSPTTSTITNGTFTWSLYTFAASGSITLSVGGPVDYLIVGAGGQNTTNSQGGSGGGFIAASEQVLAAGTFTVTVGTTYGASSSFNSQTAGGGTATTSGSPQSNGSQTIQSGTYNCPGGAGGRGYSADGVGVTNVGPPIYNDITGTSVAYGSGAAHSGGITGAYGQGDGRSGNTISAIQKGVVIVRVRTA